MRYSDRYVYAILIFFLVSCQNEKLDTLRLLIKDDHLHDRISIKGEVLYIDDEAYPYPKKEYKKRDKIKIAIDPGHIGGSMEMGQIEEKYIRFLRDRDTVSFVEGDLTLITALILEKLLSKHKNVETYLTRDNYGETSFGMSYFDWLNHELTPTLDSMLQDGAITSIQRNRLLAKKVDPRYIFQRFFKNHDLIQRAKAINEFQPNIALMLHYNVHRSNWRNSHQNFVQTKSSENYNMIFVPGSFLNTELENYQDKLAFARLFYQNDLNSSIDFARLLMKEFRNTLEVEPVSRYFESFYPLNNCIYTDNAGIYARNLALTRLIESPLCYGESLCMDNQNEIEYLYDTSMEFEGIKCSNRVYKVATCYYNAIVRFFELK